MKTSATRIALLAGMPAISIAASLIGHSEGLGELIFAVSVFVIGFTHPRNLFLISGIVFVILYLGIFISDRREFFWLLAAFPMIYVAIASLLLFGSFLRGLFTPAPPEIE